MDRAQLLREAVELAMTCIHANDLPNEVVGAAVREALAAHPVETVAGLAALVSAVGALAESRVAGLLADPEVLQVAWMRAERECPLGANAVGVTRDELIADLGMGAARAG